MEGLRTGLWLPKPELMHWHQRCRGSVQTAINAMPDAGTIKFPIGCKVKLGTGVTSGQCALTIADRVGVPIHLRGFSRKFWGRPNSTNTVGWKRCTAFCFHHVDHPRIIGLSMQVLVRVILILALCLTAILLKHIGTAGVVDHLSATMVRIPIQSFIGISISPTTCKQSRNYEISHSFFGCSTSQASNRGHDGVITSGSPNLTSAGAAFVPADVGKPITISLCRWYSSNNGLVCHKRHNIVLSTMLALQNSG